MAQRPPGPLDATGLTEAGARPRFFYGWVILGVGFTAQLIFGISHQAFQTYLVPLGAEFGWSRATLAGPRALTQAETALLGPANGWAVDRFGPRMVFSAGVFMLGLGMVLFGQVTEVWQYYAVNVLLGIGSSFAGLLVVSTALNNWFRRKRTMAIAVATVGYSLAGVLAIPAIVFIQAEFGWRAAATISGLVIWAVGLPAAYFLRSRPEDMGMLPDGDAPGGGEGAPASGAASRGGDGRVDFSLGEAMRTQTFWYIAVSNGVTALIMSAVQVHLFLHLEQGVGLSRRDAALAFGFLSFVNIGGRLVGGYLGDRYDKRLLLSWGALGTAASLVLLAVATSMVPVLVFGAIYGFAWGMRTPIANSQTGDYFGRAAFGRLMGTQQLISSPLGIAAPVIAAIVADRQGSYFEVFIALAVTSALASIAMFLARPPAPPPRLSAA
ncbi:MAG: MFS transporter [Dehalococcoidia bacterium]|nr:MFS transporter [Dehalococcoidia bacterium]